MGECVELRNLKAFLRDHFVIDDWQAVESLLSVAAAHYVPGEMLWVYLVGASRSMKTEMLRALASHPDTTKTETMTPASLRGGFKRGPKLLPRLDGKLAVTKEFAGIMTSRKDLRTELAGLLRNVADGELVADYGSDEGHLEQKVHFDWIIATTKIVERQRVFEEQLGTRFMILRWGPPIGRCDAAQQAGANSPVLPELRQQLAQLVIRVLDRAHANARATPPAFLDTWWLAHASDALAILRTPVERNPYSRGIEDIPEPELPTSIQQNFVRIVGGMTALGLEDYKPLVSRLVWDGIPTVRAHVLRCLLKAREQPAMAYQQEIAQELGISQAAVSMTLEDFAVLGVYKDRGFAVDMDPLDFTRSENIASAVPLA